MAFVDNNNFIQNKSLECNLSEKIQINSEKSKEFDQKCYS